MVKVIVSFKNFYFDFKKMFNKKLHEKGILKRNLKSASAFVEQPQISFFLSIFGSGGVILGYKKIKGK